MHTARFFQVGLLFAFGVIGCSDYGVDPAWRSWPRFQYRNVEYSLPLQGDWYDHPTLPDSMGNLFYRASDYGGPFEAVLYYQQFDFNGEWNLAYRYGTPSAVVPLFIDGYRGTLYQYWEVQQGRGYHVMAYFPDTGDGGYQLLAEAFTLTPHAYATLVDTFIDSIHFRTKKGL